VWWSELAIAIEEEGECRAVIQTEQRPREFLGNPEKAGSIE